ncbi:LANO_0F07316g1_1 [Lachancea nothofagi CBS 11611]|uniref:LANO_0F07316g1_1 n=1 Tax=Lachancea nothofagi CBS 11611 TaxID=1266666 RepID=A0A1G4K917_9SACH|nr:LANO_0F07316g1_1 [Lachancea nothofagi CBS 11611]
MNKSANGGVKKKRTKVSRACDNCRRRKIKCTGAQPCLNCQTYKCTCTYGLQSPSSLSSGDSSSNLHKTTKVSPPTNSKLPEELGGFMSTVSPISSHSNPVASPHCDGSNGLYEDDSHILQQIGLLTDSIRCLKGARPSQSVAEAIQKIKSQIISIESNWKPCVRQAAIRDIQPTGASLETQLMINKYTQKLSLTKYSTIEPSSFLTKNSALNQHPAVDDIFGLYGPSLLLSLRGIGFLFKHFFDPGVKMAIEYKTTLFLMLRFFDACNYYLELEVKSWSAPIENHYRLSGQLFLSKEKAIHDMLKSIPQELIRKTRVEFPLFERPPSTHDNIKMFHWISRMMFISCRESNCNVSEPKDCSELVPEILEFLQTEEILSVLGFEYLNVTSYTPVGDLDYLQSLLFILKHQYWVGECRVFSQLLSMATGYAQNLGLHRWEYYVGIDEKLAERRRGLWWKCYFWDKFFSIQTGKHAIIPDCSISCLLPEVFRELGMFDSDEFMQKLVTLNRPLSASIANRMLFCSLSLALIVGDFFKTVLYHKKYTDFRHQAKPAFLKEKLMAELINDVELFVERFKIIKMHAQDIKTVTAERLDACDFSPQSAEDATQATRILMFLEYATSVCLGSVEHLFARFKGAEFPRDIQEPLNNYRIRIHTSWRSIIDTIGSQNIEIVWQILATGSVLYVTVLTDLFAQNSRDTRQDVLLVLRASRNLDCLSSLEEAMSKAVEMSRIVRQLTKHRTFFQLMVRISLQLFMRTSRMANAEFLQFLEREDKTLVSSAERVLGMTHNNFQTCFVTKEKSSYRLSVERSLEQEQALPPQSSVPPELNNDVTQPVTGSWPPQNITPKEDNQEFGQKVKESTFPMSPPINFNLGSLDDFLNYGGDDLYNKLWGDINIDVPDFLSQQEPR